MKDKIIYCCPYVPSELIAAHRLAPHRLMPCSAQTYNNVDQLEGMCPFALAFINEALADRQTGGVIVTTQCDLMRRAFELIDGKSETPVFLMNIPSTWQGDGPAKLYRDELKRLSKWLGDLGGCPSSKEQLIQTMLESEVEHQNNAKASECKGTPLAIIGGALLQEDLEIFNIIKQADGEVVLDVTQYGQRAMRGEFDIKNVNEDPLGELVRTYFCSIPDASQRPDTKLYSWLTEKISKSQVKGIILLRYLWCDIWHSELYRLKQLTDIPVLDIDLNGDKTMTSGRTAQRILAFLEILQ